MPRNSIWVDSLQELNIDLDASAIYLLNDPGALSAKLRKEHSEIYVDLISQKIENLSADEQQALKCTETHALVRQVNICSNTTPLIYSKVTIPQATYLEFKTEFDNLGANFLGEHFLYKQDYLRSNFEFTLINRHITRRSAFTIKKHSLLVLEQFLNV
jgi:chorismate-pyruvate lyase